MMSLSQKKAASVVEYMCLIIIIVGAMVAMEPYVIRAINGNMKKTGDTFGMGRRYNGNTIECEYAQLNATNGIWYDASCYQAKLQGNADSCAPGDLACEDVAKNSCQSNFCSTR